MSGWVYFSNLKTMHSGNSQILILIRDCIEEYEKKHGEIKTGTR